MRHEKILVSNYSSDDVRYIIRKVLKEAIEDFNPIKELTYEKKDKLLSRQEAMDYLDVKKGKLHNMVKNGQLHPVRDKGGKFLRFWQSDLDRYQKSLSPVNQSINQ